METPTVSASDTGALVEPDDGSLPTEVVTAESVSLPCDAAPVLPTVGTGMLSVGVATIAPAPTVSFFPRLPSFFMAGHFL